LDDDDPTTFHIKQGDRLPVIDELLRNDDGTIIVLTGATVRFHLVTRQGNVKVNQPAVIVDPLTGHVRYAWAAIDTDSAGTWLREWEITFPDGKVLTVPNDREGYRVIIEDQLA
jgi:hypothetical protein